MTALDHTRAAGVSTAPSQGIFTGLMASLLIWNDQRVTRKALSRLTDRELDDIGLVRGDLDRL